MMKWGRKKTSSSLYSSRLPYLNRVLPAAWLATFKRSGTNSETKPAKEKQKGINDSGAVRSPKFGCAEERFYGGDGEAFWRLSFGEDSADGKTSTSVPRSAWYDSEDEHDFEPSSCQSCGSNAMMINEKEKTNISNMACNVKSPWVLQDMKEFRRDTQILPDTNMHIGEKTTGLKTRRSRTTADEGLKLKKTNERAVEKEKSKRQNKSGKGLQKSTKQTAEKNELEPDTPETVRKVPIIERRHLKLTGDYQRKQQYLSTMNLRTSNLRTIKEDHAFSAQKLVETDIFSPEKLSSEVGKGKEMKTEALNVKSERKSLYMSRELSRRRTKQNNKVRIFSPRTASRVEICKIKALEDMRKAKLKMKTAKQKTISGVTGLEDFAMVKCSFDPEKDFRDSMIEMIMEKNINHPEELEELLACYLTLNSDAYHDLIIKVFQQVWFDLDQPSSDTDLQNEQYFCN